jgi:hypothetical protein
MVSRRDMFIAVALVVALALHATPAQSQPVPPIPPGPFDFATGNGAVQVAIPAVLPFVYQDISPTGADATLVLRLTTLTANAWFDAIAPYHPTAIGVYSNLGRRPASESENNTNMNIALITASYRVFLSLLPHRTAEFRAMMTSVGLDPDDAHQSTDDPVGIGNLAAARLLAVREHDGMNQLGDEGGRTYHRQPYADYTGYKPVNTAYELKDPSRWQPAMHRLLLGNHRIQQFVTPQMAVTLPYSFDKPSQKAPAPKNSLSPTRPGYKAQADAVLAASAALTDKQKLIAELFNDKILGVGVPTVTHALVNKGLSLVDFVHYDFLVNAAAFDATIPIWKEKARHDSVRPFSAICYLYGDNPVTAWGGSGRGTVTDIKGCEWKSYLGVADHPEYPGGSAAICAATAQVTRLFFGSDAFGFNITYAPGTSVIEPGVTPASETVIGWDTWTDWSNDCGESRFWGGVHFQTTAAASQTIGEDVGTRAYDFVMSRIHGTAK